MPPRCCGGHTQRIVSRATVAPRRLRSLVCTWSVFRPGCHRLMIALWYVSLWFCINGILHHRHHFATQYKYSSYLLCLFLFVVCFVAFCCLMCRHSDRCLSDHPYRQVCEMPRASRHLSGGAGRLCRDRRREECGVRCPLVYCFVCSMQCQLSSVYCVFLIIRAL